MVQDPEENAPGDKTQFGGDGYTDSLDYDDGLTCE